MENHAIPRHRKPPRNSEPLFITESGKTLLFTADGLGAVTFRGKRAGGEGTIKCEKSSAHGFALNELSLAREILLELSGKCEQEVLGSKGTCTEPIKPAPSYGELGSLNGHVFLLVAPESGTKFVTVKCTNGNTEVEGAVIGEFKLNGRNGISQYGEFKEDYLLLYEAKGTTQEPEEIELLGSLMKGVAFKVEGFLGEKASEEAVQLILSDGPTEINTSNFSIKVPNQIKGANSKVTFTIKNVSGHIATIFKSSKRLGIRFSLPHNEFVENSSEVFACEKKTYAAKETCPFTFTYLGKTAESLGAVVEDENGHIASATVNGSP